MHNMMKRTAWVVGAVALATAWGMAPALLVGQETHRISGDEVAVYNLAGTVEVVPGRGSDVVVRITRGGDDADRLEVEIGDVRGRQALRVIYPANRIVYPARGRSFNTTLRVREDGTFSDGGRGRSGDRVSVRGSGRGLEAWADMVVEVPPGTEFSLYLATGDSEVRDVEGRFRIDTGSGSVSVVDVRGSLTVDTGSGRVDVRGVSGDVNVDTGSGRVDLSQVEGESLNIDTGSGSVVGDGVIASEVRVDTGSGSIELEAVSAPRLYLDTGSGSVEVELLVDVDRLDVDTGSGSVTIRAPADLGGEVEIETGSGGIDVDFPVQIRSVRRDHMIGVLGDGRGTIRIDTGSGGIRLIRN